MSTYTVDMTKLTPVGGGQSPPASSPAGAATGASPYTVDMSQLTKATPEEAPTGFGALAEKYLAGTPEEQAQGWGSSTAAGLAKRAASSLGGFLMDMSQPNPNAGYVASYKMDHPQATDQEIQQAYAADYEKANPFGARMAQHVQDAAAWLRSGTQPQDFMERVGAVGEQTIEYMGADGLLKLAGPLARGGEAIETADQLKNAQQVATTLKNNPKIAGLVTIGLKTSKEATLIGAQTYLDTQDPKAAMKAAALGGGIGLLGGAAPLAVRAAATGPIGRYIENVAPKSVTLAGEEIPALSSQVGEKGWTTPAGAVGAPEIAAAQQKGAAKAFANLSQDAAQTAMNRVNDAMATVVPARPGDYAQVGNSWVQKIIPEQRIAVNNSIEATSARSDLEDVMNSPEYKNWPEAKQEEIRQAHQQLSDQLSMFYADKLPMRMAEPLDSIRTPGQAAAAVRAPAEAGYQELNRVTNGGFTTLRKQASDAMALLANPHNSEEVAQAAAARLDAANTAMGKMIDQYSTSTRVTQQYYQGMKTAWRLSKTLDNFHARLERMTNGIGIGEAERGGDRIMTGNTKSLNNWLEQTNDLGNRTNRQDVEELMGQQGVDTTKKLLNLLAKADTARSTVGVLRTVAGQLTQGAEKGAIVGGVMGKLLGPGWALGAGVGGAAGMANAGMRQLLRYAMTNPRVGDLIAYAAENKINPQIYGPLITRTITQSAGWGEQKLAAQQR